MEQLNGILSDPALLEDILERVSKNEYATSQGVTRDILQDHINAFQAGTLERTSFTNQLEAIILLVGRPVLKVLHNTFEVPESSEWQAKLSSSRENIERAIPAVGRLDTLNVPGFDWLGTGWIVRDDIIVTNRHVASIFASKTNNDKYEYRKNFRNETMKARLDIREEIDQAIETEFKVVEIIYIAEENDYDYAFLRVSRTSDEGVPLPPPIPLASSEPSSGTDVAVIGFPARDSRNNAEEMDRIFGSIYDVKRLSPGKVSPTQWDGILGHDCTTLGGNSGSVVLDISTGEAVGLHFSGQYRVGNNAVSSVKILSKLNDLMD